MLIFESRDTWGTFTQTLSQWALQSCDKVLHLHHYVNYDLLGSEKNRFSVKTEQFSSTSNERPRNQVNWPNHLSNIRHRRNCEQKAEGGASERDRPLQKGSNQ